MLCQNAVESSPLQSPVGCFNTLVGKNLKRLRERAGLSQEEVALALGWHAESRTRISAYENGKGIGEENLQKLCDVLKCEYWELTLNAATPIAQTKEEFNLLMLIREAIELGVSKEITDFIEYAIKSANTRREQTSNIILLRRKEDTYRH